MKNTHPLQTFADRSQPPEVSSNRDHFLASNPVAAEDQRTRIEDIASNVDVWLNRYSESKQALLTTGELARQIGDKILAFAESFPGKRLIDRGVLSRVGHFAGDSFYPKIVCNAGGNKIGVYRLASYALAQSLLRVHDKPLPELRQLELV